MASKPPPLPGSRPAGFPVHVEHVWDEADTPLSDDAARLVVQEQIRYRNYASEEAMAECIELLAHAENRVDTDRALRRLWVQGVDWGSRWQDNQTRLANRKLDAATAQVRKLSGIIEQLRREKLSLKTSLSAALRRISRDR